MEVFEIESMSEAAFVGGIHRVVEATIVKAVDVMDLEENGMPAVLSLMLRTAAGVFLHVSRFSTLSLRRFRERCLRLRASSFTPFRTQLNSRKCFLSNFMTIEEKCYLNFLCYT